MTKKVLRMSCPKCKREEIYAILEDGTCIRLKSTQGILDFEEKVLICGNCKEK